MNIPDVSIIVPVYKVEKYLRKCLDSIIGQTLNNIEIIVVDKGDKDECREIIDAYAGKDKRIIAPHKSLSGYGAQCNIGLSLATGKYIAIAESDDWVKPEMYRKMFESAELFGADVVKAPYLECYENGDAFDCSYRKLFSSIMPANRCFSAEEHGEILACHASIWSALYRTDYIRKNNICFVEASGAGYVDVGFRIDTLTNTDRIFWLDEPLYCYRKDSINSSTNIFKTDVMIERWREQHDKKRDNEESFNSCYWKYLVHDEYANTLAKLRRMKVSSGEAQRIKENMDHYTYLQITDSPALKRKHKAIILFFRMFPYFYWCAAQAYANVSHDHKESGLQKRK